MTTTLGEVVQRMRARIKTTDDTDLVTQDLIIELTAKLEEAHWMVAGPAGLERCGWGLAAPPFAVTFPAPAGRSRPRWPSA